LSEVRTIHLVPVGEPDPTVLDCVAGAVAEAFGVEVERAHPLDAAPGYDDARGQYSSRHFLRALAGVVPGTARVLGVADVDLFQPILTFVFGEAQLGGRLAVMSTHRLSDTFYGLPESYSLLQDRAVKEAVHELGHTFGLVHCPDRRCAMTASRVVEDIDLKGAGFCPGCASVVGESV
jgi:archaemetzincin